MDGGASLRVAAPRGSPGVEPQCSSPALSTPSASAELSAGATGELCRYSTAALSAATDGFSPARLLGEGGYGEVFAARFPDGSMLAVKRMAADATEGESGFLAEVSVTGAVRHPNVLPVLGVAVDDARKCLVYPLMRGGSLGDRLRAGVRGASGGPPPLGPLARADVAAGTARGLAELHTQGIIHRDVKSTNILLDDAGRPLVADMGLCRVLAPAATHTTTRRMGTDGYIDPEYSETLELREQSDVYSFGVVLLELLSNQAAYTEGMNPPGLVGRFRQHLRAARPIEAFADASIGYPSWMLADLAQVAEKCLKLPGSQRPRMREVVRLLERIALLAHSSLDEAQGGSPTGWVAPVAAPSAALGAAALFSVPLQGKSSEEPPPATQPQPPPASQRGTPPQRGGAAARARAERNGGDVAPASAAGDRSPPPLLLHLARSADERLKAAAANGVEAVRRLGLGGEEALQSMKANAAAAGGFEATLRAVTAPVASGNAELRGCTPGIDQLLTLMLDGSSMGTMAATMGGRSASGGSVSASDPVKPADVPGLEAVIDAMRAHALANGPDQVGCAALLAVADAADLQLRAATAGGIEAAVQAMRLHAARPQMLEWSAWALHELAVKSANNKTKVAALGGLEAVVTAMEAHPTHAGLQEQGCLVLAVVAADSGDGAAAVRRSGGVQAAARALREHGEMSPGVAARAAYAIAHAAAGDAEAARVARDAGAKALCERAMAAWPAHRGVQANGRLAVSHLAAG